MSLRIIITIAVISLIVPLVQGCSDPGTSGTSAQANTSVKFDLNPFSKKQICKAAISTVMGRNPSVMSIDRVSGNIIYVSYVRADDGSHWSYRCKLNGSRVVWSSKTGRWRNSQFDSKITFSVNGKTLSITESYSDGSATHKSFKFQQLGG